MRHSWDQLTVGVVGLGGTGSVIARRLAEAGVGELILADPYCPAGVHRSRQDLQAERLAKHGCATRIGVFGEPALTEDAIARLVRACDCIIGCFGAGFRATNIWLNRAACLMRRIAVFAEHDRVGPLVLPGYSACYLCYRMRALACADDFEVAMQDEEALTRGRAPTGGLDSCDVAPLAQVGESIVSELRAHHADPRSSVLCGHVRSWADPSQSPATHHILPVPHCPVCGSLRDPARVIAYAGRGETRILTLAPLLISPATGIVREITALPWAESDPDLPHVLAARIANHRFEATPQAQASAAIGKGPTLAAAAASVLGEALERYAGSVHTDQEIVYARRSDLDGPSLDPRRLVLYGSAQYRSLPYAPFDPESIIGWTACLSLGGVRTYVPAQAVYIPYVPRSAAERLCQSTSNGMAAGATLADALFRGLCEILERDAFLITWHCRLPARRVHPLSHPNPWVTRCVEALRRRGAEIYLFALPVDHPCRVFAAFAIQTDRRGPAVALGLGADLSPAEAARRAILEVAQVRLGLELRLRDPATRLRAQDLFDDSRLLRSPEDHGLRYCVADAVHDLDFLLRQPPMAYDWRPSTDGEIGSADLLDHFRARGQDVLYRDLTPPDIATLGIHVVRVLVPDYQPLAFGYGEERLGGTRLFEQPRRLGLAARRMRPSDLNLDPHPIA